MRIEKVADIKENDIAELDAELLVVLLKDRSSGRNILWATDNYLSRGISYAPSCPITVKQISGKFGKVIRPRIDKSKKEQEKRIKDKAEVFTPSWICNKQNNAADNDWFECEGVFNTERGQDWITNAERITFPEGKTWQDYVKSIRLEITCGEAPYLCSRYDTTTGEWIEVNNRIGVLDRKIRVINENVMTEKDWYDWVVEAYKSTYGYEWQGDSVLIARENLLYTFIDYYLARFEVPPIKEYLFEIAKILSWNIWQMDGLKYVIPNSCQPIVSEQLSFFTEWNEPKPCPGCKKNSKLQHTGVYSKIMNWATKRAITFVNIKGAKNMKFDYVIGNPPYQIASQGENNTFDTPIYHKFMDESAKIADRYLLITPGRFLFDTGGTPSEWNQRMLSNPHLKIVYFEINSNLVFKGQDIKGGVAISYYDTTKDFGAIEIFTAYEELNGILNKVKPTLSATENLSNIIYTQTKFNLDSLYADYPEYKNVIGSEGRDKRLRNNIFEKVNVFTEKKELEDDIEILGVIKNRRVRRYINRKYIDLTHENLFKYKVIVPAANGSGAIGEVLSTPLIGEPLIGVTQTFITIGAFNTEFEANSCLKYIKSKFARTMLGVLKATQHNPPEKWRFVPLQDFTPDSDIDWSMSVAGVDAQLYKKYGLSKEEIAFIERNVREME